MSSLLYDSSSEFHDLWALTSLGLESLSLKPLLFSSPSLFSLRVAGSGLSSPDTILLRNDLSYL